MAEDSQRGGRGPVGADGQRLAHDARFTASLADLLSSSRPAPVLQRPAPPAPPQGQHPKRSGHSALTPQQKKGVRALYNEYPSVAALAEAFRKRLGTAGRKRMSRLKRTILRERAEKAEAAAEAAHAAAGQAADEGRALLAQMELQLQEIQRGMAAQGGPGVQLDASALTALQVAEVAVKEAATRARALDRRAELCLEKLESLRRAKGPSRTLSLDDGRRSADNSVQGGSAAGAALKATAAPRADADHSSSHEELTTDAERDCSEALAKWLHENHAQELVTSDQDTGSEKRAPQGGAQGHLRRGSPSAHASGQGSFSEDEMGPDGWDDVLALWVKSVEAQPEVLLKTLEGSRGRPLRGAYTPLDEDEAQQAQHALSLPPETLPRGEGSGAAASEGPKPQLAPFSVLTATQTSNEHELPDVAAALPAAGQPAQAAQPPAAAAPTRGDKGKGPAPVAQPRAAKAPRAPPGVGTPAWLQDSSDEESGDEGEALGEVEVRLPEGAQLQQEPGEGPSQGAGERAGERPPPAAARSSEDTQATSYSNLPDPAMGASLGPSEPSSSASGLSRGLSLRLSATTSNMPEGLDSLVEQYRSVQLTKQADHVASTPVAAAPQAPGSALEGLLPAQRGASLKLMPLPEPSTYLSSLRPPPGGASRGALPPPRAPKGAAAQQPLGAMLADIQQQLHLVHQQASYRGAPPEGQPIVPLTGGTSAPPGAIPPRAELLLEESRRALSSILPVDSRTAEALPPGTSDLPPEVWQKLGLPEPRAGAFPGGPPLGPPQGALQPQQPNPPHMLGSEHYLTQQGASSGSFYCMVCNQGGTGALSFQQHHSSRRHLRNAASAAAATLLTAGKGPRTEDAFCKPDYCCGAPEGAAPRPPGAEGGGGNTTYIGLQASCRSYCNQVITTELNRCVVELLQQLLFWQERSKAASTINLPKCKRLVSGLREVAKAVKRKARCVIVAPNIEQIEAEGGLDDLLDQILTTAQANGIPIVFALSRKKLGQVFGCRKKMSAIAILDFSGAQGNYARMLELSQQGRSTWALHKNAAGGSAAEDAGQLPSQSQPQPPQPLYQPRADGRLVPLTSPAAVDFVQRQLGGDAAARLGQGALPQQPPVRTQVASQQPLSAPAEAMIQPGSAAGGDPGPGGGAPAGWVFPGHAVREQLAAQQQPAVPPLRVPPRGLIHPQGRPPAPLPGLHDPALQALPPGPQHPLRVPQGPRQGLGPGAAPIPLGPEGLPLAPTAEQQRAHLFLLEREREWQQQLLQGQPLQPLGSQQGNHMTYQQLQGQLQRHLAMQHMQQQQQHPAAFPAASDRPGTYGNIMASVASQYMGLGPQ